MRYASKAVIWHTGRVLLMYNGIINMWELPGGGVGPGESIIDSILREVLKETGLTPVVWSRCVYGVFVNTLGETTTATYVDCTSDSDDVALSDEHEDFLWAFPDALPLNIWPDVVAAIEKLECQETT